MAMLSSALDLLRGPWRFAGWRGGRPAPSGADEESAVESGLAVAAELALSTGDVRLASLAVTHFAAEGGDAATVSRLRGRVRELDGLDRASERAAIEALARAGRHLAAWKRLQVALDRWPGDEELERLGARLG